MSNFFYTSDGRTLQMNVENFSSTDSDFLNIPGNMSVNSRKNNNKLLFSNEWSAFPDNKTDGAEISNDTGAFKTLMVVGNKSDGSNIRNVGVWDKLTVNGQLCVSDKCVDRNSFGPTVDPATAANIKFTKGWTAYPDNKTDGAEISNDTGVFKTLMLVGNKSDGTNTRNVSVWDKLTVNGQLCVGDKCVDKNSFGASADQATAANIKITKGWTAYPDNKTDAAEISNDTGVFKSLMIVGNKSAGTGTRNVSVWDKLTVNGQFCVGGTCIDEGTFARMINRTR